MATEDLHHIVINAVFLFCFIFISSIGVIAYRKLRHHKIRYQLKHLFYCSLLSAFGASLTWPLWKLYNLFGNTLSPRANDLIETFQFCITFFSHFFFVWCLLATFVMRLHFTFKSTAYEMNRRTVHMFTAVLIVEGVVLFFMMCIILLPIPFREPLGAYSFALFLTLYVIASIVAVLLFLLKLSQLTQLQNTSQRDLSVKIDDIKLSAQQQRTLDLSAKYLLLFAVAIVSTIVSYTIVHLGWYLMDFDSSILACVDHCINALCLYLQFAPAKDHYRMCCGRPHSLCKRMVSTKARKSIRKNSLTLRATVSSESAHSAVMSTSVEQEENV